ncbi:unnamed protein product [Cladocopium goreaui]|uniref:Structural maintenance of chromosomes protein 5 n=1 Tax=Cladocopium goreaui TaxID=2562237 RepID=A0A9P1FJ59_9DINO|nr:unnamed protein product [Cladocopium goreaui]
MSKRSSGDAYGASKNQWHDMPGVHADALGAVSKEVALLLTELSKLWCSPELSAEDAQTRANNLRSKLGPILENEKNWLQKSREKLDKALDETGKLAQEVGETPPVKQEKESIAAQRSALKTEMERLTKLRARQGEEVKDLRAKVRKECKRLHVNESDFVVDESLEGGAQFKALTQQLQRLDGVVAERVDAVLAARGRIRKLKDKLGENLEFRLAFDGELPGSEGGVVVLEKTAENEKFIRDLAEFKDPGNKDVSLFSRCIGHLKMLESSYSEELDRRKPQKRSRSSDSDGSRSRSRAKKKDKKKRHSKKDEKDRAEKDKKKRARESPEQERADKNSENGESAPLSPGHGWKPEGDQGQSQANVPWKPPSDAAPAYGAPPPGYAYPNPHMPGHPPPHAPGHPPPRGPAPGPPPGYPSYPSYPGYYPPHDAWAAYAASRPPYAAGPPPPGPPPGHVPPHPPHHPHHMHLPPQAPPPRPQLPPQAPPQGPPPHGPPPPNSAPQGHPPQNHPLGPPPHGPPPHGPPPQGPPPGVPPPPHQAVPMEDDPRHFSKASAPPPEKAPLQPVFPCLVGGPPPAQGPPPGYPAGVGPPNNW